MKRINNKDELLVKLSRSLLPVHLAVKRKRCDDVLQYYHHFLVEEVNGNTVKIIQNGKCYESVCMSSVPFTGIHRTTVNLNENDLFDFRSGLYSIDNDRYPKTKEQAKEAIRRAELRLGQQRYQLSNNNCEHFVTYVLTGKPYCTQLDNRDLKFRGFVYFIDLVCDWKYSLIKRVKSVYQFTCNFCINIWEYLTTSNRIHDISVVVNNKLREFAQKAKEVYSYVLGKISRDKIWSFLKFIPAVLELNILIKDIYGDIQQCRNGYSSKKSLVQQILKKVVSSVCCAYLENYGLPGVIKDFAFIGCTPEYVLVLLAHLSITILVPLIIDACDMLCNNISVVIASALRAESNFFLSDLPRCLCELSGKTCTIG